MDMHIPLLVSPGSLGRLHDDLADAATTVGRIAGQAEALAALGGWRGGAEHAFASAARTAGARCDAVSRRLQADAVRVDRLAEQLADEFRVLRQPRGRGGRHGARAGPQSLGGHHGRGHRSVRAGPAPAADAPLAPPAQRRLDHQATCCDGARGRLRIAAVAGRRARADGRRRSSLWCRRSPSGQRVPGCTSWSRSASSAGCRSLPTWCPCACPAPPTPCQTSPPSWPR